ncbi:MAG: NADH-quinone oxidoreductase subunit A [Candidatus Marinimicrobia bacterium]|nr:NADH-quinone oxidoreductase subunit A [Candidatus Neomarinimicrobiota bacterium]MCF7830244.1 NADH-quinone oxidoreductase subunit A [Candidatus Neomarinimicrobiota bacterium]MCF7882271.1 NADH-quinone oxidoreductase subunit A [Candidatus Neomarinimicrobiota bacterium]
MVGVTYFFGGRHKDRETDLPFESGIQSTGNARIRFSAKFYLVAMLFVIFDLEVVFIFAWAIAGKELGWTGYGALAVFMVILVAGLIYEWRMGALDWKSTDRKYMRLKEVQ